MIRGLEGVARYRVMLGGGRVIRDCGAVVVFCIRLLMDMRCGGREGDSASTRMLLESISWEGCRPNERLWWRAASSPHRAEGLVSSPVLLALQVPFELWKPVGVRLGGRSYGLQ